MEKKCLTVVIILLLFGTSTIPAIANNAVDLKDEKEPACMGFIYREVGNSHGMYTWSSYPFALVTNGIKWIRCGLLGQYLMRLSLYHKYNVTAHVTGFKPLTKHVYLTEEEPIRKITFDIYGEEREDVKSFENSEDFRTASEVVEVNYFPSSFITEVMQTKKQQTKLIISEEEISQYDTIFGKESIKNSEKTENTGKIYGYTHCSHGVWTWDPIPHAIVRIGLKITRSDNNGYYEITGLPLNRTYRVVANHLCYIRRVEKVTLTAEKPVKNLYIDMEWVLEYIFDILDEIIKFLPHGVNFYKK
jgi:hypothetical protein